MKIGFLITARLKSTRLPMKLLKEVHGEYLITWMIRRLKLSPILDEIVIATSTNPQDDELEIIAQREGVKCFRGSEEDVSLRLTKAAEAYGMDYFISMTADCPLLPYEMIGDVVDTFKSTNADLITCYEIAAGLFLTGVKGEAMKKVIDLKASENTEYWLYYFLKTDLFNVVKQKIDTSLIRENYRFTLDYPEDYTFLKAVYEGLGPEAYKATTKEIIEFVDQNPELAKINEGCNEKMLERSKKDPNSEVKLKEKVD